MHVCELHSLDLLAIQGPSSGLSAGSLAFIALSDILQRILCGCNCGFSRRYFACLHVLMVVCACGWAVT